MPKSDDKRVETEVETEPDAWDRFKRTTNKIVRPKWPKKENVDRVGGQDQPDRPKRKKP